MTDLYEEIKKLQPSQKADLYNLLRGDEELKDYISSNELLFEELNRRDKALLEGKIHFTTREELSTRLKQRRYAL
jgi:hypothetical protein